MRISAKDLGWLAESDFCPRDFWIERHAKALPFQMGFPGIFSSIDAYTKDIVERYFERNRRLPGWLGVIGDVKRILRIKASEFKTSRGDATLTGIPDLMFQRPDDSFTIVDYKTAKYTGNQDSLMPIYEVQLNGYAYIAEALGYAPVKDLYLVYFEPPYREVYEQISEKNTDHEGFSKPFRPKIHMIRKDMKGVERLLDEAERIYKEERPPAGKASCKECERLKAVIDISNA